MWRHDPGELNKSQGWTKLNKRYSKVRVEGFKKHDVHMYIKKFFTNNLESAESLIYLLKEESLIAKTMAPYPIFCCMLCHMWKWIKESDRERVRKLKTFSELIQEMINALVEQYASKVKDKGRVFERLSKAMQRQLSANRRSCITRSSRQTACFRWGCVSRLHGRHENWMWGRGFVVKEEIRAKRD